MNKIYTMFVVIFVAIPSYAEAGSGAIVGGYDVFAIASDTISVIEGAGKISAEEAGELRARLPEVVPEDPLTIGPELMSVYDALGRALISSGTADASDIESINMTAAKSGGLKLSGRNPLILAASYLDFLSQKGIIPLQKAQSILDKSH